MGAKRAQGVDLIIGVLDLNCYTVYLKRFRWFILDDSPKCMQGSANGEFNPYFETLSIHNDITLTSRVIFYNQICLRKSII